MMPPPQQSYRRAEGLKLKEVGNSTSVFVAAESAIHVLNPTAQLIFEFLETPATWGELALALQLATGAETVQIEEDLGEALEEMQQKQILESVD